MTTASDAFEQRIAGVAGQPADDAARAYLALGEEALEAWVEARGETPTADEKEGFRLLALHRQGAAGEPSFNACRETCRELAYRYNVATSAASDDAERTAAVAMMNSLVLHLYYFVSGKLQVEGLGEFCCSSKPLRLGSHDTR